MSATKVDFEKLCSSVLSLDGVRFCAVRKVSGEIIAGGQKPSLPTIESEEERTDSNLRITILVGLLRRMPESFGKANSVSIDFHNVRMLVYPLPENRMIHVTMEPSSPESLVRTVSDTVSSFQ